MSDVQIIKVSDFSNSPFGRYPSDSNHCGEFFRKNILIPALSRPGIIKVDMDTGMARGYEYGSSFLHEAFGGLVLKEGYSSEDIEERISILSKFDDLVEEVGEYMKHPEAYV